MNLFLPLLSFSFFLALTHPQMTVWCWCSCMFWLLIYLFQFWNIRMRLYEMNKTKVSFCFSSFQVLLNVYNHKKNVSKWYETVNMKKKVNSNSIFNCPWHIYLSWKFLKNKMFFLQTFLIHKDDGGCGLIKVS